MKNFDGFLRIDGKIHNHLKFKVLFYFSNIVNEYLNSEVKIFIFFNYHVMLK